MYRLVIVPLRNVIMVMTGMTKMTVASGNCDNRGMSGDVSVNISWSGGGDTVCSNDAANGDSSDADNGDESLHQPFHH